MTQDLDVQEARRITQQVIERAHSDQQFEQELIDDPAGTLLAAGLPAPAVAEVLYASGLDGDDVGGFLVKYQVATLMPRPTSTRDDGCGFWSICDESIDTLIISYCGQSVNPPPPPRGG